MRLFNRIYGVAPGRDAPKLDRLLWFRSYYLRNLPLMAIGIGAVSLWHWWLAVLFLLPWLAGFARLNMEIRTARRRAR
jgi:hypothetical protein